MKYVDLHLHLDGAVTVAIARKLAKLQGITLPESDQELKRLLTVPEDCESLTDFLKCFALPLSLMQTREGLSEAIRLVENDLRSQGVIYAEIRFAPQLHTEQGMTQEDAVLAALEGLKQGDLTGTQSSLKQGDLTETQGGMKQVDEEAAQGDLQSSIPKVNLILCAMRGDGNEAANEETLRLAGKYLVKDGGVVAMDLAGAEALFPTGKYRGLFSRAKELGIPFTIHAGEADGAESVKLALEYGASRIGHGVRSYEDPKVLQFLKEKQIPLEMCPTSNRQTHAVEDMEQYPFMDYLRQGLKVTLNTDDPGIEGTTLEEEYRYMEQRFGLDADGESMLLQNAVDAAFTTDVVKNWMRKELRLY
ncbi:MAG: adenosine deaminase family protein [Acetatifactor sp.]|nr:adenosine deaminase family protein [Acetatifactor sp.]